MKSCRKELLNRYGYLDFSNESVKCQFDVVVHTIDEEGLKEELDIYLAEEPNATFTDLFQHMRMYWLPVIAISDDEVDFDAMYEYEGRMMEKLSRFIYDERSRYHVWDRLVFISMQRQFMSEMENFVDQNPQAGFEELEAYCKQLSKAFQDKINKMEFTDDDDDE